MLSELDPGKPLASLHARQAGELLQGGVPRVPHAYDHEKRLWSEKLLDQYCH